MAIGLGSVAWGVARRGGTAASRDFDRVAATLTATLTETLTVTLLLLLRLLRLFTATLTGLCCCGCCGCCGCGCRCGCGCWCGWATASLEDIGEGVGIMRVRRRPVHCAAAVRCSVV